MRCGERDTQERGLVEGHTGSGGCSPLLVIWYRRGLTIKTLPMATMGIVLRRGEKRGCWNGKKKRWTPSTHLLNVTSVVNWQVTVHVCVKQEVTFILVPVKVTLKSQHFLKNNNNNLTLWSGLIVNTATKRGFEGEIRVWRGIFGKQLAQNGNVKLLPSRRRQNCWEKILKIVKVPNTRPSSGPWAVRVRGPLCFLPLFGGPSGPGMPVTISIQPLDQLIRSKRAKAHKDGNVTARLSLKTTTNTNKQTIVATVMAH